MGSPDRLREGLKQVALYPVKLVDRSTGFELFREYFSHGLVRGLVMGGSQFVASGIMHLPEFNGKNRDGEGLVYANYLFWQIGITMTAAGSAGYESLPVFLTLKFIGNVGMNLAVDTLNGAHQLARRVRDSNSLLPL